MSEHIRVHPRLSLLILFAVATGTPPASAKASAFELAPAVAVEAEDFVVQRGWKAIRNGGGNYMVDIVGFQHISGERLLHADKADTSAVARADIRVPAAGDYRLWVRYEYPTFTDTRFRVTLTQGGEVRARKIMGMKDNPRLAFGDVEFKAQYDPSWGSEGLVEEVVDAKALNAGPARITLEAVEQPQAAGRTANRNIDFVYLSSDMKDTWREHYRKRTKLYPILDALRDTVGPRWEIRLTNKADKPARLTAYHHYNRIPWGVSEGVVADKLAPGASTGWIPIRGQDTTHFSMMRVNSKAGPFVGEIRAVGEGQSAKVVKLDSTGDILRVYMPPYAERGPVPIRPEQQQRRVLDYLAKQPKIGKAPTLPLCYGAWLPVGADGEYGRNYARIYQAIGMRSFHSALQGPWERVVANLKEVGIPLNRSAMVFIYRLPPVPKSIEWAKKVIAKKKIGPWLKWYDYGDEIGFGEWIGYATKAGLDVSQAWRDWLGRKRAGYKVSDYWLDEWGKPDASKLRPFSDGAVARRKPRLYVDSLIFYEDFAIDFVRRGKERVKAAFGQGVLCGANYSGHPFYHPSITMYVKWFRGGAADFGRHSEYFWQVCQPGPMVNGYIAEHFRAGMKDIPGAILRQYTMPHVPGNTEASFLRTAFTHLAHGAKMLDFFGIGMNECFTENHIDHQWAPERYAAIRDVTHSIGLVEDLMLDSRVVPSKVALLLSDSTERWDFVDVTGDRCRHKYFGPDFRKTRLSYHLERLGIWTCLTYSGHAPDLIVEEDLNAKTLADYRVLYVVGDHIPVRCVEAMSKWVRGGGVLLATAGAGRYDEYHRPNPAMLKLLGLAERKTEQKVRFMRPRQELPFLKPLAHVVFDEGSQSPVLAIRETIRPADEAKVLLRLREGSPAVIWRTFGKGKACYAALPAGLSYMWQALQPPAVPDRGPAAHSVPQQFNFPVGAVLCRAIGEAGLLKPLYVWPGHFDARLIESPRGWFIPIANYNRQVGKAATVSVRFGKPVRKVTSAHCGSLAFETKEGRLEFAIPKIGYGDIIRLDP